MTFRNPVRPRRWLTACNRSSLSKIVFIMRAWPPSAAYGTVPFKRWSAHMSSVNIITSIVLSCVWTWFVSNMEGKRTMRRHLQNRPALIELLNLSTRVLSVSMTQPLRLPSRSLQALPLNPQIRLSRSPFHPHQGHQFQRWGLPDLFPQRRKSHRSRHHHIVSVYERPVGAQEGHRYAERPHLCLLALQLR